MVRCLLCKAELEPLPDGNGFDGQGIQLHPEVIGCQVTTTDAWGVAIDLAEREQTISIPNRQGAAIEDGAIVIARWPFVDDVLGEFFAARGLPRLGGQSSGRGWSSFSTFQKCPYLWQQRYLKPRGGEPTILIESPSLAIGTIVHVLLALHYAQIQIGGSPYAGIMPEDMHEYLLARCNPEFVVEGWRVFSGYRLYYSMETIEPLAIEHDLVDPRTGESCRFDLIAFFPEDTPMLAAGTYNVEHKTASRFDYPTLNGWVNDGEVIGQTALWKRLGLDHRFGPLRGVIVNILGKQPKELKFHRAIVSPHSWQVEQHLQDLARWEALINLARTTNSFPRARQSCIGRYGMCDLFDHCAGAET